MSATEQSQQDTALLNGVESGINLDTTANGHVRTSNTDNTLTTVFQAGGAGFIGVQAFGDSSLGSDGEVRVYDGSVADANLIAKANVPAGEGKVICANPAFFSDGVIVQAKADGTNPIECHIYVIAGKPVTNPSIIADKVTYINGNAATTNYGGIGNAECRNAIGQNKRILLEFNLTSVPFGLEISSATMTLTVSSNSDPANEVKISKVLKSWTEGGVNWNTRDGAAAWSTAGLGAGTDKSAAPDLSVATGALAPDESVEIDVTDIVQDWLDGTSENHGLILEFDTLAGANSFIIHSDDAGTEAYKPVLNIVAA